MLAVEVDLLTGRYTATRHDDRDAHEWPPHPGRFFSALVAVWGDDEDDDASGRQALEWLEQQDPPSIVASDVAVRAPGTHFVPDNDVAGVRDLSGHYEKIAAALAAADAGDEQAVKALAHARAAATTASGTAAEQANPAERALRVLPEQRSRQGRSYPTVRPDDPRVHFVWPAAAPAPEVLQGLDRLLSRVWRLGHSSTLVSCRRVTEAPAPTHVPAARGALLRVPVPGLLAELERQFERHHASQPRILPSAVQAYGLPSDGAQAPVPLLGGDWFVLAPVAGPGLPLAGALDLARAVRAALLSHADDPPAELLSGHVAGAPGKATPPSRRPHLAVVPLPFVGRRHADGHVVGVALALPRDATRSERQALLTSLGRWRGEDHRFVLTRGRAGRHELVLTDELEQRATLHRDRWCRASRRWASVSPVALDRFPGDLGHREPERAAAAFAEAERLVASACGHAGLPEPTEVVVSRAPLLTGVPPVRRFPSYRVGGGRTTRVGVHAALTFPVPVAGPVLLGAGRYLGRGLCLPLDDGTRP